MAEIKQADLFMKISGADLKGESDDTKHKGWIELETWDIHYEQPGTPKKGGGATEIDRARHDPLKVSKRVDSASAALQKACWKGDTIKTVRIENFRSTDEETSNSPYLIVEIYDVIITDYALSSNWGELPKEDLEFAYTKIKFTYVPITKKTGKFEGKKEATHDLSENVIS